MAHRMKPEERKALLLQHAQQLFRLHGFEQVRVDDIMKSATISKGGFYHHFTSKNDVMIALVTQEIVGLSATINDLPDDNPIAALIAIFQLGSRFIDAPDGIGTTLSSFAARALYLDTIELAFDALLKPSLQALITKGCDTGAFRPVDAQNTAELIIAVNNHANRKSTLQQWPDSKTISFSQSSLDALGTHLGISQQLASIQDQLGGKKGLLK